MQARGNFGLAALAPKPSGADSAVTAAAHRPCLQMQSSRGGQGRADAVLGSCCCEGGWQLCGKRSP